MDRFRLLRGEVILGTVIHTPEQWIDGSVWDLGKLDPSPEFEAVEHLFTREQALLTEAVRLEELTHPDAAVEAARLLEAAAGQQREIVQPGVWLIALSNNRRTEVGELHIDAGTVYWR